MLDTISNIGYGGEGLNDVLPGVLAELQGFTISGPLTGAGASTPIAVPSIDYNDTVLKALLFTAGVPSDITSDTSILDRRAKGTLTIGVIVDGDYVTVNGNVYTFRNEATLSNQPTITTSTNLAPGVVPFTSGDPNDAATALAVAIMGGDPTLLAYATANVVTVQSRTLGITGNSVGLVASNGDVVASGATLTGGTATNAIEVSISTSGNLIVLFWYNKNTLPFEQQL